MLKEILLITTMLTPISMDQTSELPTAERGVQNQIYNPDVYTRGDCESLANVFRHYGMTDDEYNFFFTKGILERESGCGQDTYNERTGDTGVCQLTHLHSKPGYFFGKYYESGWAVELFGLRVGKRFQGIHRNHPNIIPACLWLLRGGSFSPGTLFTDPWKLSM